MHFDVQWGSPPSPPSPATGPCAEDFTRTPVWEVLGIAEGGTGIRWVISGTLSVAGGGMRGDVVAGRGSGGMWCGVQWVVDWASMWNPMVAG